MVRDVTARANGADAPLLTLREAAGAPTDFVSIFGRNYDVVDVDAMGLRTRGSLQALFDRVNALERKSVDSEITDADEVEYDEKLRAIMRCVIPSIEDATLARMTTGQCAELVGAFFAWRATKSGAMDIVKKLMSESSSRGLPASTAAANGSSRHRTRSSGRSPR